VAAGELRDAAPKLLHAWTAVKALTALT